MNNLGIEKEYKIIKKVRRKLILNDKVINFLFNKLKKQNYVYMTSSSSYIKITPDLVKELLKKAEHNDNYWRLECFAQLANHPEYEGVPFKVTHASPYDHRWPGDYDEDAYDDWEIRAISLEDLFFENLWDNKPVYLEHPEMFDFENEEVLVEDEKLIDTHGWW